MKTMAAVVAAFFLLSNSCHANATKEKGLLPSLMNNTEQQIKCLAVGLYYESRGESLHGQKAVADVVVNRALSRDKSLCHVLAEKNQFHWDARKMYSPLPKGIEPQHGKARKIVAKLLMGKWKSSVGKSEFFLSGNVRPKWVRSMTLVKKVGGHRFYRLKRVDNKTSL